MIMGILSGYFSLQNPDSKKRKEESDKVREKYPDRIPIIIEKDPNSQIKEIDRTKFLVPNDLTAQHLIFIIRKRLELGKEETIFMLVDGKSSIAGETALQDIYDKYKDKEDGYLYIVYTSQLAWG
eukprot:CAMPEP_0170517642 /NCGR_PEP_ID=MMETSP0209-20121228/3559_1 /TAXON_ID=665100 ORGANISM="Litonotus pictus, Strain P1" /NCGR_SAMPLE_ID=MMETSP0209 /ASSEMBLY_ACC=CAM_ASM_000301 /LENGTH=124 /DNA_ID=CAMNT_0010802937 /DNA_START=1 /DNA_END=376 /DNA_ORIENTATION=-